VILAGDLVKNAHYLSIDLVLMRNKPRRNDVWNENDVAAAFRCRDVGLVIFSDAHWSLVFALNNIGWTRTEYLKRLGS